MADITILMFNDCGPKFSFQKIVESEAMCDYGIPKPYGYFLPDGTLVLHPETAASLRKAVLAMDKANG